MPSKERLAVSVSHCCEDYNTIIESLPLNRDIILVSVSPLYQASMPLQGRDKDGQTVQLLLL